MVSNLVMVLIILIINYVLLSRFNGINTVKHFCSNRGLILNKNIKKIANGRTKFCKADKQAH